jgi:hypothetical protein
MSFIERVVLESNRNMTRQEEESSTQPEMAREDSGADGAAIEEVKFDLKTSWAN